MGLLDDAIREHLDLKRRHGADPTEIEREEREALGPVRRGPGEPDELPLEPAAAADEELIYDDDDEDLAYDEGEEQQYHEPSLGATGPHDPFLDEPETAEPRAPGPLESVNEPEPEASWAYDEPPAPVESSSEAVPAPAPVSPKPHPAGHVGEETAEYNVDLGHDSEKEGDEILEETPEFLQDAPDHDRLWFEQRPPRDFDFDG
jgi:hypothetical protein